MSKKREYKFLVVILPRKDRGLYEEIEYAAEVEYGIQTIFCIDPIKKQFDNEGIRNSYFNTFSINLSFKINSKHGGFNHTLDLKGPEKSMEFFGQKTMAVGVDVTHPAAGSGCDAKSIAAVVASTGIDFAQFPGCIRIQTSRVEMVEKLSEMMRERLDLWKAKNKNDLPDRVVLFRDGVSEGWLETVLDKEKSQLDVLFGEMYRSKGKPVPKLTIIVVDERHHTRFYQEKKLSLRESPGRNNRGHGGHNAQEPRLLLAGSSRDQRDGQTNAVHSSLG